MLVGVEPVLQVGDLREDDAVLLEKFGVLGGECVEALLVVGLVCATRAFVAISFSIASPTGAAWALIRSALSRRSGLRLVLLTLREAGVCTCGE